MTPLSKTPHLLIVLISFLFSVIITTQLHAQCALECKDNPRVSLCYESTLEVTPEMVLKDLATECLTNLVVDIFVNGDSIGNEVNYYMAGQTLEARVRDTTSSFICSTTIQVQKDEIPPTPVCDENTVTTLSSENGSVIMCAEDFDSGSYDNCFLQSIKIRRMDDPFYKTCIRFDCDDVGAPVMIVLQARDYEGLTAECMVELTVQEKVPPMIECADDVTVDCTTDIDAPNFYQPFVMDNCEIATVTYVDDDRRNDCGVGIVIRTFTATDIAGNTATCVQTITLEQNKTPLVFFPTDKVLDNCEDAFNLDVAGRPELHDYCSNLLISHKDKIFESQDQCTFKIQRIWSILDWCSFEEKLDTQTIKVNDKQAPTFTTDPGSLDGIFECADDVVFDTPEASDDCGDAEVSLNSDEVIPGDCPNRFTRIITFIATDNCGNVSDPFIITITVNDQTPPTSDPLPDIGPFQCYEDIPAANPEDVTGEADNCGGPVVVNFIGDSPDPGCSGFVTRTYQLTDECNNSTLIMQSIEINDDTAPTTNPLPDLGPFACFNNVPEPDVSIVQATDNCGDIVTITFVGDSPNPGCVGTIVRTYRATDSCGNTTDVTQNIAINDDVPPNDIVLPDLGPFQCYANRPAPTPDDFSTTDNCGLPVTVTFVSDEPDPGCMGTVVRSYLATDACGNTTMLSQNILIEDTTPPTADPIDDLGPFVCVSDVPAPDISLVTGETDNCGGNVIVAFSRDEPAPNCAGFYRRFYSVTDQCGNSMELMQQIQINDNIMPTADPIPAIGPFTCIDDVPAPDVEVVTGEADNCGGVIVSFVGDSDIPVCIGMFTRTYRITDDCGNFIERTQQISINDNIPPTADPLVDEGIFDCIEKIPAPDINIVQNAVDNCGGDVIVEFVEDSPPVLCTGVVSRTYSVTDVCGNVTLLTQNFTIQDTIIPTGRVDPLGPFACYEELPEPDNVTFSEVIDNGCNHTVRVTFIGPDTGDPGCDGIVTRMYRLRDECGNDNFIFQTIQVKDTIAPTADPLPDLGTFACLSDAPAPDTSLIVNEMDNCGDTVFVNFLQDISQGMGCPDTIMRVYQIADMCGNTTDITQRIFITDDIPPTADPLPDLGTFECYDSLPAPDITKVMAMDNCDDPITVEFIGDSGDPGCGGVVTRTYQLTDFCGNMSTVTETATVLDDVAPVIICPTDKIEPIFSNAIGDCEAFVSLVATATDNCSSNLIFTNDSQFSDDPNNGADASGDYPLGVTFVKFVVDDGCGNKDSCTVRVEVIDIESPTLTCTTVRKQIAIDPITMEPIAVLTIADISERGEVFDFCTPITTFFEKDTFTCDDLGLNPYTLTAIDTFGNTNQCMPNNGVFLEDPDGLCGPTPPPAIIGGRIETVYGETIEDVMVQANNNSTLSSMTDQEGNFLIAGLEMNNDYMIKPTKDDDHLNGVSTLDMVSIGQHILGVQEFDSPYQLLAADVNRSGTITAQDLLNIRQILLGKIDGFPNNTSWRFVKEGFEFNDMEDPFGESLPEGQMYENMEQSELNVNFIGFKVGDVNQDAQSNSRSSTRSSVAVDKLKVSVDNLNLIAGQEYEIAFKAKDFEHILGYQFTLGFDERILEFIDLIPGDVEGITLDHFGTHQTQNGKITTSFANLANIVLEDEEVLFTIKFKAYTEASLDQILSITSDITKAEAYKKASGNTITLMTPELVFGKSSNSTFTIVENTFRLYQNRPNPFTNQTLIGFDLPDDAEVTFQIFDLSGRQIQSLKGGYTKGYNEIKFDSYKLPTNGIYYYRLDTPFGSATRKMVLISQ